MVHASFLRLLLCCAVLTAAAAHAGPEASPTVVPGSTHAKPTGPPSPAHFARRYGESVAVVYTRDGARAGLGFFIATSGALLTSIPRAKVGDDVIVELPSVERRAGQVAVRDKASALALVKLKLLDRDGAFSALGLSSSDGLVAMDAWIIGLAVDDNGRASPAVGGLRRIDDDGAMLLDLPCDIGAPVLNPSGRVVAVVIGREGRTLARAMPIAKVRAFLSSVVAAN